MISTALATESSRLPVGDHTPARYTPPLADWKERIKRPLRRIVYPPVNAVVSRRLAARYARPDFAPDLWLWGQRGNDYERHRRRVNRLLPLRGRRVLVAGCGTGRDLASWVAMQPGAVVGVDWFDYSRAWQLWQAEFARTAPSTRVQFVQGELSGLDGLENASFDVVGSDAVFEHVRDLPAVLAECSRVLRPGGLLYATFGPLWYCWGGDHVSGYDAVESGYNHLLLSGEPHRRYMDGLGPHEHSEEDGRTWIEHGLFSYVKPPEYLHCLSRAGLKRVFVAAIIEPLAFTCFKRAPSVLAALRLQHNELDLIVTGMTVIYKR